MVSSYDQKMPTNSKKYAVKDEEGSEDWYHDLMSHDLWRDRLNHETTFKDWKLHRPQVRKMMNTGKDPEALPTPDVNGPGNIRWPRSTEKVHSRSSRSTEKLPRIWDNLTRLPPPEKVPEVWGNIHRPRSTEKVHDGSGDSQRESPRSERENLVRKRILISMVGLIALMAVIIPIVVVVLLQKPGADSGTDSGSDVQVATVDIEVTIQDMEYTTAMADAESEEYRNFTLQFCQEIGTFYQASNLGEKYDGCLVTDVRNGSLIAIFTTVFESEVVPAKTDVELLFTGSAITTLETFKLMTSTIVIDAVKLIDKADKPTPRLEFGESCKVHGACKTYQAECLANINECGCSSSRYHSSTDDWCKLSPTTLTTTPSTGPSSTQESSSASTTSASAKTSTKDAPTSSTQEQLTETSESTSTESTSASTSTEASTSTTVNITSTDDTPSTTTEQVTSPTSTSSSVTSTSTTPTTTVTETTTIETTTMTTTSTTTTEPTTLPYLEVLPDVTLHVPAVKKLEIGKVERIICQVDNATEWTVITFSRTREDNSTQSIGGAIINDDSWESFDVDSSSNMHIFAGGFYLHVSVNVSLMLDVVQCDDGARYHCSVEMPEYRHAPVRVSEDLDAFKMPVVQLGFPADILEGELEYNIACTASLGYPEGTLTLQRKLPMETDFKPFEPHTKNTSNIRREESANATFPCLKDVIYDFETGIEGWDMTQIRCAINQGTDSEILSETGDFMVISKTVCSGKSQGQNVPHPFDCAKYITCKDDVMYWGDVHQSSCSYGECWLPDGQCGTTTTTTPGPTTYPPHLPYIQCAPKLQAARIGESVSYSCSLRNVEKVTEARISELGFDETGEDGLSGTITRGSVELMIDLSVNESIVLTVNNVDCSLEGDMTIVINDDLSSILTLRIIGDAATPMMSLPDAIYSGQMTFINCSGNVGRLSDGSRSAELGFAIKRMGMENSITGSTVLMNSTVNCENELTIQQEFFLQEVLNGAEILCVSTDIASQSRLFSVSSGPLVILQSNINFDNSEYESIIGETLPFTCSFQGIADVDKVMITRGSSRENVIMAYRNGTDIRNVPHFTIAASDWGEDSGSVTIEVVTQCEDETTYYCEVGGFEVFASLSLLRRPDKPILTLSYEQVEGQEPLPDKLSECKGQIGNPEGDIVIEVLSGGEFVEYDVILGDAYPADVNPDCGTERTIQFYFGDLADMNGTQVRCTIKASDRFSDAEFLTSDTQVLLVIENSYCDGINSSFYVHPYDCHYFVDCNFYSSGDFHFTQCLEDRCPNPLGGCDYYSCDTVCNGASKSSTTTTQLTTSTVQTTFATTTRMSPYLICGDTIQAELASQATVTCEIGNTVASDMQTLVVYQGETILFSETGESGTASSTDGFITLTYTHEQIRLDISQLHCYHDAVYTVDVNAEVTDNFTILIETSPGTPAIEATRFIIGQQAGITCRGDLGKPQDSRELLIEMLFPFMSDDFSSVPHQTEDTLFSTDTCSYVKTVTFYLDVMEYMQSIEARCRTSTEIGNVTSEATITVNVEPQEVDIAPLSSEVVIGDSFSIECTVGNVSGLTSITFYRDNTSQPVCSVATDSINTDEDGLLCSGETTATSGSLKIDFPEVRCRDNGIYYCNCNPEASNPKKALLSITKSPSNPVFTDVPRTLVDNIELLSNESFRCEGELGYPATGRLAFLTNQDGDFEKYPWFGEERTTEEVDCVITETITVTDFVFDSSWNNTLLRCVIEDNNGTITNYASDDFEFHILQGNLPADTL